MLTANRYAELHAHSAFSFLDGASEPEEMVVEAARLGLAALAITDHDGLYGVVRFAEAAREAGLPTVFGAEVTLGLTRRQTGVPDPAGHHLVVLARDPAGYARLSAALADAQLAGGAKGRPVVELSALAGAHGGHWLVLTGCRKGQVPASLIERGPATAGRALDRLVEAFGRANVAVELWNHDDPVDEARNDALARLAVSRGVDLVATTNAHFARPAEHHLAAALAAVRARRSLDDMDGWLPAGPGAHLRSGTEQTRRFARYPGVVARAGELGVELAFDLGLLAPGLPPFPVPAGHDEVSWLRHLVAMGAAERYGSRDAERVRGAWTQIDHELEVIEALGFPGYFLVVWDIVRFCREAGIYCQGRGSAANSAVCYALGITNADAVALGLLFERFLSPARDGPPDIDVDIESGRREEAIQYVYERYGRRHAAQVANVITYRGRSAIRDAAKALGYPAGAVDAWSAGLESRSRVQAGLAGSGRHGRVQAGLAGSGGHGRVQAGLAGSDRHGRVQATVAGSEVPAPVVALASQMEGLPRHLGVHSGGMVICDRPVVEVCPVEWATAPGRTVLQWDKEDCAAVGLVKFDLLGLGMLEAIHRMVDLVGAYHGVAVDLAGLPQELAVYEMLCAADTVGVFQVESRAQMATLPRLRPTCFYDLVVEVALIRPGPIQGGSVHPYLRRRNGTEAVTYLHPLLRGCLEKTLGIPLFQEQLMQMAIAVAGFSADDADRLRQAMSAKRSARRMEALRGRFYAGMADRGITGGVADEIWAKMAAFANFGFPESHATSFAYLVYSSAWVKLHYPAAFLAGLLNSQPMGFWAPRTLVADARRHGVQVRRPDVNRSGVGAILEPAGTAAAAEPESAAESEPAAEPESAAGTAAAAEPESAAEPEPAAGTAAAAESQPGEPGGPAAGPAVRLGLASVRGLGEDTAARIVAAAPYRNLEDLARRAQLSAAQLESLATAGATASLDGGSRRGTLWAAGALGGAGPLGAAGPSQLEGLTVGAQAPALPPMSPTEEMVADLWATGVSVEGSLTELVRSQLDERGVILAARLHEVASGAKVVVAGVVTHRQRPETARGVTFLNLEDETGLVNVICSPGVWERHRRVANSASAMVVSGRLESVEGVVNVVAERIEVLELAATPGARNFC